MDFSGTVADIATTLRQGWLFTGQPSAYAGRPRGTDPDGVPPRRFVIFIQNHDQVGNRALGERLNHQVDLAAYRAASVLLLCAPQTPLLFMGQEWAASTPFPFFTDHNPELGRLVTEGRRREFSRFSAFSSPGVRERIPDPQALSTFKESRLDWAEREREPHASTLRLYRHFLGLRRTEPALGDARRDGFEVWALDEGTLAVRREAVDGSALLAVVRLAGSGTVEISGTRGRTREPNGRWNVLATSEDPLFCPDPQPPEAALTPQSVRVAFARPGAVVLGSA